MNKLDYLRVELRDYLKEPVVKISTLELIQRDIGILEYRAHAKDPFVVFLAQGGPAGGASCEYGDAEGDE